MVCLDSTELGVHQSLHQSRRGSVFFPPCGLSRCCLPCLSDQPGDNAVGRGRTPVDGHGSYTQVRPVSALVAPPLGSLYKRDVTDSNPVVPTSQNAPYPIFGTGRE